MASSPPAVHPNPVRSTAFVDAFTNVLTLSSGINTFLNQNSKRFFQPN